MEAPTLIDLYDDARMALTRIHILTGISSANKLTSEEIYTLCEVIHEIAETALQTE